MARSPVILVAGLLLLSLSARAEKPPKTVKSESRSTQVSRTSVAFRWPLSIDEGWVECVPPETGRRQAAVLFHAKKKVFAVNAAGLKLKRAKALDAIWEDDANIPGAKINLGPLIDRGLALCK